MFQKVKETIMGKPNAENVITIKASVVLMKKSILDFIDLSASVLDRISEILGRGISFQLISAVEGDPKNENRGRVGKAAYLEKWVRTLTPLHARECTYVVTFEWDKDLGVPGAVIVKNFHCKQFFLKTLTLHNFPGLGQIHFDCNSWVYPVKYYDYDRIFFTNHSYLPSNTPEPLRKYREEELVVLRGNGTKTLKEWDRVYDYAPYNDLGMPDKGQRYDRPVLGEPRQYPYPRRGRTGRPPSKTDSRVESRLPLLSLDIYVPRDERFGHIKMSDVLSYALKSIGQVVLPAVKSYLDRTPKEFDTFQDVLDMFEGGIKVPTTSPILRKIRGFIPFEMIRELIRSDGELLLKFPVPQVIQTDKTAWRTDEEFAREMLAGVNPIIISRLKEFPPRSNLDPNRYGNQHSSITEKHILNGLHGLTVDEALTENKLFILDHHDTLMPYVERINTNTTTKMYATRTILFLKDDGTLTPLAIELSLPHPYGEQNGAVSKVFTPAQDGVKGSIWQLAKAYVAVNDSGYHQLISHWLNTHAVIEPFVIATNRRLSVLHPIHKLLTPHYRDTMHINALARHTLINAGGVLEHTVFPEKYALPMSSEIYRNWVFTDQALPADLIKRGVAVKDPNYVHNLRLLIEDYPYAVDGLEIWDAIQTWVHDYCHIYYSSDTSVQADTELQSWWTEIREVGHGDIRDDPRWLKMDSLSDLIQTCTIIIWIASALHAAVNFGQYPYAGYLPNRPTVSRRFMPEPGSPEYAQLESDPDLVFLNTITAQLQTLIGVSLIEVLSRHSTDEVYLGQRPTSEWTADTAASEAFKRLGKRLVEIENRIVEMNMDRRWKNRVGPVKVPYTLLYPNTSDLSAEGGLTGMGIPNSISI